LPYESLVPSRPSCCSPLDRAQLEGLCNGPVERRLVLNRAEGHDAVRCIVADVGAAAVFEARTAAPVLDDRDLVTAEFRVIFLDVPDPPEPQPRGLSDVGARGHMKHRAVDPVEMLADLLD